MLGFPLCSPFDLLKENGSNYKVVSSSNEFKNHLGKIISIIGYLVTRKRTRTKRGEEMAFGTFLDKEGKWIDTTHFPNVFKQYPFTGSGCYLVTGKVVQEFDFYSLDVTAMNRLEYRVRE